MTFSPYAIEVDRFSSDVRLANDVQTRRKSCGLDPSLPVVVFSGKLQHWKRPQDVVRAVARVSRPVQALFIGDGPMRGELERLASELGARVHFAGFVNQVDIPAWYSLGDILVLPSGPGGDTWGLVVNEALATGLTPVVSDAVPCWPDLAWVEGGVYPVGDIQGLAECIVDALDRRIEPSHHIGLNQYVLKYNNDVAAGGIEVAVLDVVKGDKGA